MKHGFNTDERQVSQFPWFPCSIRVSSVALPVSTFWISPSKELPRRQNSLQTTPKIIQFNYGEVFTYIRVFFDNSTLATCAECPPRPSGSYESSGDGLVLI